MRRIVIELRDSEDRTISSLSIAGESLVDAYLEIAEEATRILNKYQRMKEKDK